MGTMNSLYIVVPCYNEEEVLPASAPVLLGKQRALVAALLDELAAQQQAEEWKRSL